MLIIWVAFLNACIVYAVVLFIAGEDNPAKDRAKQEESLAWMTASALSFCGVLSGILIGALKKPGKTGTPALYLFNVQQRMIMQAAAFESVDVMGLVGNFGFGLGRIGSLCFIALSFLLLLSLLPGLLNSIGTYNRMLAGEYMPPNRPHLGGG
ncbi:hypothetical protein HY256_08390 [Candidatus Sumerlaeota bacterium]|nr:hypothetical protein [Candidatus Sumerlaeota bacterium]